MHSPVGCYLVSVDEPPRRIGPLFVDLGPARTGLSVLLTVRAGLLASGLLWRRLRRLRRRRLNRLGRLGVAQGLRDRLGWPVDRWRWLVRFRFGLPRRHSLVTRSL